MTTNDYDPDGTFAITSITSTQGTVSDLVNGEYTFTPNQDYVSGPVNLTYEIMDDDGAKDTATAAVAVTPANQAPMVTAPSLIVSEGMMVPVSPADLGVSDFDDSPQHVTIQLSNVTGGKFINFVTADQNLPLEQAPQLQRLHFLM